MSRNIKLIYCWRGCRRHFQLSLSSSPATSLGFHDPPVTKQRWEGRGKPSKVALVNWQSVLASCLIFLFFFLMHEIKHAHSHFLVWTVFSRQRFQIRRHVLFCSNKKYLKILQTDKTYLLHSILSGKDIHRKIFLLLFHHYSCLRIKSWHIYQEDNISCLTNPICYPLQSCLAKEWSGLCVMVWYYTKAK